MDRLRLPFLVAALILMLVVLFIELGSTLMLANFRLTEGDSPPGYGIPYMALLDGLVVYTLALMTISVVVPQSIVGRFQGCATLILSILIILAGIVMIFVALAILLLMIGLLLSFFGAIVYFAVWGSFPRGEAAGILALLLLLKIVAAVCLVLAHERFLQNVGFVLMILSSLVANIIISFLHDFLPGPFVSITDAVAGIIVAIIAVIWAIVLLIGGVIGVLRIIQAPKIGGEAVTR